jgi:hypothetical protein
MNAYSRMGSTCWSEADVETKGIWLRSAMGMTASDELEKTGPMTASTSSPSRSLNAMTAWSGLVSSFLTTTSTWRPLMPPFWLICATARFTPFSSFVPRGA